jgi:hypothetical protein
MELGSVLGPLSRRVLASDDGVDESLSRLLPLLLVHPLHHLFWRHLGPELRLTPLLIEIARKDELRDLLLLQQLVEHLAQVLEIQIF